ncbi:MAG: cbb3-type cytochrome c oxidase N-terminal domain-containing protein, partial [Cyclobacteriaceae bacterium]
MRIKILVLVHILLMFFGVQAFAQTVENNSIAAGGGIDGFFVLLVLVFIVVLLILMVTLYLFYTINLLLQQQKAENAEVAAEPESFWKQMEKKLTKAVPVEREKDVMLDHEYDGIRELDNHLPPWWTGLFYFTIAFGVVYLLVYHVFEFEWAPLQEEAYEREMAEAEEQRALLANMVDESSVQVLTDESALANGKAIFDKNCAACHATDGGGNTIGPNLTDNYWIHGGDIRAVFTTIKYGVEGEGMAAWGKVLPPKELQEVASFIMVKLVGSEPMDPK